MSTRQRRIGRHGAQAGAFDQPSSVLQPQLAFAQSGQRRPGQGIEGDVARPAPPALQLVGLAPGLHMRVPALRTLRPGRVRRLQNLDRLLALVDARQHPQGRLALSRVEPGQLAEQLLKIGCAHRRGPLR